MYRYSAFQKQTAHAREGGEDRYAISSCDLIPTSEGKYWQSGSLNLDSGGIEVNIFLRTEYPNSVASSFPRCGKESADYWRSS